MLITVDMNVDVDATVGMNVKLLPIVPRIVAAS
jgi:hypothetical protein